MKKGLSLLLTITMIGFVSAFNGYDSFSLGNLLDSLDPSTAILGSIFILSFALINFALSNIKKFQDQKGIIGIISFIISFLITYSVHKSGFDYSGIYYNMFEGIGLSSGIASTLIPIILLIGAILIIFKFGFETLIIVSGLLIFFSGLAGFVYETGATMLLGGIITIIGFFFKFRKKKRPQSPFGGTRLR